MRHMTYIDPGTNPLVDKVVKLAFPKYRGKKIKIIYETHSMSVRSYWQDGYRDYYALVSLQDGRVMSAPTSHPWYDRHITGVDNVTIPPGYVVVEHSLTGSTDSGITIYVPGPPALLPSGEEVEVTDKEAKVLNIIYGTISSYRKEEYRRHGIRLSEVEQVKSSLQQKGLLNKAGAITTAGKNAVVNRGRA